MKTLRMKIKMTDHINKALEIIASSRSKKYEGTKFGMQIGFEVIMSYMGDICKRAIEIDDHVILDAFVQLGILTWDSEEEKMEHERKFKEITEGKND